jgi:hypothetical protein
VAVGPDRAEVKRVLRAAGLSDRQIRALFTKGWAGLVGEREAELAEALEKIADMSRSLSAGVERQ